MTYNQAVQMADKALDQSLEALNNGELSKYVKLQKHVDYLNGIARALKQEQKTSKQTNRIALLIEGFFIHKS